MRGEVTDCDGIDSRVKGEGMNGQKGFKLTTQLFFGPLKLLPFFSLSGNLNICKVNQY